MESVNLNGLKAYRFPGLGSFPQVIHAIFTRQGGVSQGPYQSLNVSRAVGDHSARVQENLRLIQQALGLRRLVSAAQVHGNQGVIIPADNPIAPGELPEADILITAQPGVGLLIKQADCQAVLFYDPEHQVVANAHVGWRGQIQRVLAETVICLGARFKTRPEVLRAAIGPGLGPCCAEFRYFHRDFPREFWRYQKQPGYFDLWQLSFDQLVQAGLKPQHIEVAGICTRCRSEEFFSYRRDKITGRQAAVIGLRA
jgi:YfiH family protein|uniref:Purine nucleoside phosphorylase n=1 Tax=Desulfobacca acetoxidans TaxID=60893 RepID=A0A7C5ERQ5_9BACT